MAAHRSCLVYLGISGVLHPSESLYEAVHGHPPWQAGHKRFEALPHLEDLLRPWPVQVVLTSTRAWKYGLDAVVNELGPVVGPRVVGATFPDLTMKSAVAVRQRTLSEMDYWRLRRGDVVRRHVALASPAAWIALDDDPDGWSLEDLGHRVVLLDGTEGLMSTRAQRNARLAFNRNFRPVLGKG